MKMEVGVIATDGVNRQNIMLPLSTLVESMEAPLADAVKWGIPYGMPVNVAHDNCKPIGWSCPRGVYLAKDMARQLAQFYFPETEEDRKEVTEARTAFIRHHQSQRIAPDADELLAKISAYTSDAVRLWHVEATAAIEFGLASKMFPEFFDIEAAYVDKDGLTDLDYLLSRTEQVHPGVFREPQHGLLLFAHSYFRRSLSAKNSLNIYVLNSIMEAAALDGITARLRLDPDMLGHPGSARGVMELEYWHGPKYNDDIAAIPSGVAEHKSDALDRQYSGIDKTQIWWKDPEQRVAGTERNDFRTFEVEELIENESFGLPDNTFGCRYAHAEYDLGKKTISHFDGAIRAYDSEAYLKRIEQRIDRAGKQAKYTKLFRFDGPIPVPSWKRILSDWFRGNNLIPEYLGASEADLAEGRPPERSSSPSERPTLAAFLCFEKSSGPPTSEITLRSDQEVVFEGRKISVTEIGLGRIGAVCAQWLHPDVTTIAATDSNTNLARICLPNDPPSNADWQSITRQLANAILCDAEDGLIAQFALAISWNLHGIQTTLSVEGHAQALGSLVSDACLLVRPEEPASVWIEQFRDALIVHAPELTAPVYWPQNAAQRGRLTLDRTHDVEFQIRLGEAIAQSANLASSS